MSFVNEVHQVTAASLLPGSGLDNMNRCMLKQVLEEIQLLRLSSKGQALHLYSWIQEIVFLRSCAALYGETHSPMNLLENRRAFMYGPTARSRYLDHANF